MNSSEMPRGASPAPPAANAPAVECVVPDPRASLTPAQHIERRLIQSLEQLSIAASWIRTAQFRGR